MSHSDGVWVNFVLRVVLFPAFVVKTLIQLPQSIIREEPRCSNAFGAKATLAAATPDGTTNGRLLAATASGCAVRAWMIVITHELHVAEYKKTFCRMQFCAATRHNESNIPGRAAPSDNMLSLATLPIQLPYSNISSALSQTCWRLAQVRSAGQAGDPVGVAASHRHEKQVAAATVSGTKKEEE